MGRAKVAQADKINHKEAAFIAIKSLAYISQSPDELAKFLNNTGLEPTDVIRLRENMHFLGGVLDFVTNDQSLLLAFCSHEDFSPAQIENARYKLTGRVE